jgi:hypothetical protein
MVRNWGYFGSKYITRHLPNVLGAWNLVLLQDWRDKCFRAPCCWPNLHNRCLACKAMPCDEQLPNGWAMCACIQHSSIHHAPPVQSNLIRTRVDPGRSVPSPDGERVACVANGLYFWLGSCQTLLLQFNRYHAGYKLFSSRCVTLDYLQLWQMSSRLRGVFGKMCRV